MIIEKNTLLADLTSVRLNKEQEEMFGSLQNYLKMSHHYRSAMGELGAKLETLDEEFQIRNARNPIHHMESRLKSPQSIIRKLRKKGKEISLASARENVCDIAGIRVICYYVHDIYSIAELLLGRDDIHLLHKADYIENSKASGYRSVHLDISVPVQCMERTEYVPVELQIRTIAMDFWASLEHQLRYKDPERVPVDLKAQLKDCAEEISKIDYKMQEIYDQLKEL